MTVSTRDILLQAAQNAPKGRIDDPVRLDTDLGLYLTADPKRCQKVLADVPVDRVVALGRRDFLAEGDTWRSAVSSLHCTDWTDAVFDYFDNPLLDASFPAPAALYEMRLSCVGGLCVVGNGNHRAVAGRAWLTSEYGNAAHWKQVRVQYEPLSAPGSEILELAAKAGCGLRVAIFNLPHKQLCVGGEVISRVAALRNQPHRIYAMGRDNLTPLSLPWHHWLGWQLGLTLWRKLAWREIPHDLVVRLLDDGWIENQLPKPPAE